MKPFGLYIHIPFCLSKCPYCDFYSIPVSNQTTASQETMDAYTDILTGQLEALSHKYPQYSADTVYFGGGTPALLGAKRLNKILLSAKKHFSVPDNAEITLEANPCLINKTSAGELILAGFNRISMGIQSLQDEELAVLGRRHDSKTALTALCDASHAGFKNISADLMLATPGQTTDSLNKTLDALLNSPISHISAYLLKIEPNTPYFKMAENGKFAALDEDIIAECYEVCVDKLTSAGFLQYEISNFAKPGYECKHNLKYWLCEEYLGLGPHAHSFIGGKRFDFNSTLKEYTELWQTRQFPMHHNGTGGDLEEKIMLGLRLSQGINLSALEKEYRTDLSAVDNRSGFFEKYGLLMKEKSNIFLTAKGFLVSNSIISELLALL